MERKVETHLVEDEAEIYGLSPGIVYIYYNGELPPDIRNMSEDGREVSNSFRLELCFIRRDEVVSGDTPFAQSNIYGLLQEMNVVARMMTEPEKHLYLVGKIDWDMKPRGVRDQIRHVISEVARRDDGYITERIKSGHARGMVRMLKVISNGLRTYFHHPEENMYVRPIVPPIEPPESGEQSSADWSVLPQVPPIPPSSLWGDDAKIAARIYDEMKSSEVMKKRSEEQQRVIKAFLKEYCDKMSSGQSARASVEKNVNYYCKHQEGEEDFTVSIVKDVQPPRGNDAAFVLTVRMADRDIPPIEIRGYEAVKVCFYFLCVFICQGAGRRGFEPQNLSDDYRKWNDVYDELFSNTPGKRGGYCDIFNVRDFRKDVNKRLSDARSTVKECLLRYDAQYPNKGLLRLLYWLIIPRINGQMYKTRLSHGVALDPALRRFFWHVGDPVYE